VTSSSEVGGVHVRPLITVRGPEDGDSDGLLWPAVDEELTLRLEDGEILRWRGRGHLAEARRLPRDDSDDEFLAWTLKEVTDLVVTDRRLAYAGQGLKIDRRGPFAQTMAETRQAYDALPEGGRVLVGQVRFQWPVGVSVQRVRHLWPGAALVITCVDDDSEADLVLMFLKQVMGPSPHDAAEKFARALVSDIARFRLSERSSRLTRAEVERIVQQRDRPTPSSAGVTRFDLPGALPVGSGIGCGVDKRPATMSRPSQATVDALRLAAEEASDGRLVDTLDALLGICRLEVERWTPAFVRMEFSVDGLRAQTGQSPESIDGAIVAIGEDATIFELQVTAELEDAMRLAEQIAIRYGFEVVAPSHLALAIALSPGRGSSVLRSGVASPAEVITVLSETLFDTTFVGIERVLAETIAVGRDSRHCGGPMVVEQAVRPSAQPAPPGPEPAELAATPVSDREAAWAASPHATRKAPTRPEGHRLGFLERIGVIALLLVLVLVLVSIGGAQSTSAAAHDLARGRAALARGDQRTAVRAWRDVLRTAPRSLSALVLTSCVEWKMRYTDEAVSYYQSALVAGLPWDRLVVNRPCFVNAPTLHGLQMTQTAGLPILFAIPSRKDRTGVALEAIAAAAPGAGANPLVREALARLTVAGDDPTRPVPAQSLLAAACLNDRSNLRMIAAMDLTLALNDPRMPRANGILRSCALKFRGRYVVVPRSHGQEIFLPKDLGDRTFLPDSSPIPGRLPQPLP
jgi:hypothetical protein